VTAPETLSHHDLGPILELLLEKMPNQLPSKPVNSGQGQRGAGGLKLAFVVDGQIDLNSRALLDMISEEAVCR